MLRKAGLGGVLSLAAAVLILCVFGYLFATEPMSGFARAQMTVLLVAGLVMTGVAWGEYSGRIDPPARFWSRRQTDPLTARDLRAAESFFIVLTSLVSIWILLGLVALRTSGATDVRLPTYVVLVEALAGPLAAGLVTPVGAAWLMVMWKANRRRRLFDRPPKDPDDAA